MAILMMYACVCITILKYTRGTDTLLPSGIQNLSICPSQLFTLRCETVEPFQKWNVTIPQFGYSESRLVGVSEIVPLRSNYTSFNFTRESASPLVTSLTVINATADLRISCIEYTGSESSVNASLIAAVHIIRIQRVHGRPLLPASELNTIEEQFSESNVTVILKYHDDSYNEFGHGVTLNTSVEVMPQVPVVSNGTHFELTLLYNTLYNISARITLCGLIGPSMTSELFYGSCRRLLVNGKYTDYKGYSNPALEGTTVTFSCPPEQVLLGPNASMCMENGEWEPDPREAECRANCNIPTHPLNGYILPYTSTIEGARLTVLCLTENGLHRDNISTAVCTHDGNWVPNPAYACKNTTDVSPKSAPSNINIVTLVASTVVVFFSCSVIFFLVGVLCTRFFQSKTIEHQRDVLNTAVPDIQGQSVPIYESVGESMLRNEYDLKENIAYGHIVVP